MCRWPNLTQQALESSCPVHVHMDTSHLHQTTQGTDIGTVHILHTSYPHSCMEVLSCLGRTVPLPHIPSVLSECCHSCVPATCESVSWVCGVISIATPCVGFCVVYSTCSCVCCVLNMCMCMCVLCVCVVCMLYVCVRMCVLYVCLCVLYVHVVCMCVLYVCVCMCDVVCMCVIILLCVCVCVVCMYACVCFVCAQYVHVYIWGV